MTLYDCRNAQIIKQEVYVKAETNEPPTKRKLNNSYFDEIIFSLNDIPLFFCVSIVLRKNNLWDN